MLSGERATLFSINLCALFVLILSEESLGTVTSGGCTLSSPAFRNDSEIPPQYTCDGINRSPPLSWNCDSVNHTISSFVLILDDPDAPSGDWVHWVVCNIPNNKLTLLEGEKYNKMLEGVNDFGSMGYGGPCPPQGGTHHYHFKLYALNGALKISDTTTKDAILSAMDGHVVGEASMIGLYQRSEKLLRKRRLS